MVMSNTCGSCESAARRGGAPGAIILTDHSLTHSLTYSPHSTTAGRDTGAKPLS